jgi:hypothetical protein
MGGCLWLLNEVYSSHIFFKGVFMKQPVTYSFIIFCALFTHYMISMENQPLAPGLGENKDAGEQPPPLVEIPLNGPASDNNNMQPNHQLNPPPQDPQPPQPPITPVPPTPPVPPTQKNCYERIHGFVDRTTGFVDMVFKGCGTLYTKYPVFTKLSTLVIAGIIISRNEIVKNVAHKIKEGVDKLLGTSSEIDEDLDEEDEEEEKPVYTNKLLLEKV